MNQLTCVFVDHGLLRRGEAEQVEKDFVDATGVDLVVVDAADRFLAALAGVSEPEEKRKIIGREFIRAFERAARDIVAGHAGMPGMPAMPDEAAMRSIPSSIWSRARSTRTSSSPAAGPARRTSRATTTWAGLPDDLQFSLVEPLRDLFKDEVRQVGLELGVPDGIVWRQPFPGPGLGIRVIGEVTLERLEILRAADAIAREELTKAGLDRDIWQCPVVLLADIRSVGVQGRRAHLRPSRGPATGEQRGRDDGGLDAGAVRRAGHDLDPHHQ